MGGAVKISEREYAVLGALVQVYDSYVGPIYLPFSGIADRAEIDIKLVRRTVRSLARKGLAEYARGLWTEDGEMAGAGYGCTRAGLAAYEALAEQDSQ